MDALKKSRLTQNIMDALKKSFLDHIGYALRGDESPADAFDRLRVEQPDVFPAPKQSESFWDAIRKCLMQASVTAPNYDRRYDTLTEHWPVERLEGQRQDDDTESCIAEGWLYRVNIGRGWTRIGLTAAGKRQIDVFAEVLEGT